MIKKFIIFLIFILISCDTLVLSSDNKIDKIINKKVLQGVGFYQSLNQIDSETLLIKYHSDNFIKNGNLQELIWMAKSENRHEPFKILILSNIDTLWVSSTYITGYVECEREIINKNFNNELDIFIIRENTKYPININITTIIN